MLLGGIQNPALVIHEDGSLTPDRELASPISAGDEPKELFYASVGLLCPANGDMLESMGPDLIIRSLHHKSEQHPMPLNSRAPITKQSNREVCIKCGCRIEAHGLIACSICTISNRPPASHGPSKVVLAFNAHSDYYILNVQRCLPNPASQWPATRTRPLCYVETPVAGSFGYTAKGAKEYVVNRTEIH